MLKYVLNGNDCLEWGRNAWKVFSYESNIQTKNLDSFITRLLVEIKINKWRNLKYVFFSIKVKAMNVNFQTELTLLNLEL